jgi:hypothetical protein
VSMSLAEWSQLLEILLAVDVRFIEHKSIATKGFNDLQADLSRLEDSGFRPNLKVVEMPPS